jgi:chromate reductase, NAD(P)H dehydrogenase (quinone)
MKILIFLGSARISSPPNPPRLGERVARACQLFFPADADLEIIDPLNYSSGEIFKPHFSYSSNSAPETLQALAAKIGSADAYVMISPEYNHSMSPALAHLLNHFGSSLYAYKPSLIVTYSAGQWGGTRAAVGMRTFLSELGCLPVSAMLHIPRAQEVFDEQGQTLAGADNERWAGYFKRAFLQLIWWTEATQAHKKRVDPHTIIANFKRDPSQRNAP